MTQPLTELQNAMRVTTHQANGANLGTFRVVHQIKVHICVLWEAMYYMFTSGGQCTTYVLFIQSHCRLANLLSLLVTSTQPPGHTTMLDGLWSVIEGASRQVWSSPSTFPSNVQMASMRETVIYVHNFCLL